VCVASPDYLRSRARRIRRPICRAQLHHLQLPVQQRVAVRRTAGPLRCGSRGDFRANSAITIRAAALEGIGIAHMPVVFVQEDIDIGRSRKCCPTTRPPPVTSMLYPRASGGGLSRFVRDEILHQRSCKSTETGRTVPRIRAKVHPESADRGWHEHTAYPAYVDVFLHEHTGMCAMPMPSSAAARMVMALLARKSPLTPPTAAPAVLRTASLLNR